MGINITLDLKTTRDARSTVAARGLVVAVALGAAFVAHSASRKQPFVVVNMLARNAPLSVLTTRLRAYAPTRLRDLDGRLQHRLLLRVLARERSRPRMPGLRPLRPVPAYAAVLESGRDAGEALSPTMSG
jgi:hypothetical protein